MQANLIGFAHVLEITFAWPLKYEVFMYTSMKHANNLDF